jgi:hypothetical protein
MLSVYFFEKLDCYRYVTYSQFWFLYRTAYAKDVCGIVVCSSLVYLLRFDRFLYSMSYLIFTTGSAFQ